jgi:sugar transferase (PEP-CTERM/EpsH1 system associated)
MLRGALLLPTSRTLTHALLDSPEMPGLLESIRSTWRPDVVLAYCSGMARFAMERPLDTLPFVLDMVDVDSAKWEAMSGRSRAPKSWIYAREARHLRTFERAAASAAASTLVVSDREAAALLAIDASLAPQVVPNAVDIEYFRPAEPISREPVAIFTGVFGYGPNDEAARWLIEEVWPLVRAAAPEARLQLVGRGPSASLKRVAEAAGAEVTGQVPDVRPYLWRAAVAVAPLLTARGTQNKVLEAIAAGLPAVVTPTVVDGLPHAVRAACIVAETPSEFARAMVALLGLPAPGREAIVARASLGDLAVGNVLAPLEGLLTEAVRTGRGA